MNTGINNIIFRDVDEDAKEKNVQAVKEILENLGFIQQTRKNVFVRRGFSMTVSAFIEKNKIILHTAYARKVKSSMIVPASRRLLELNAKHHLLLGIDRSDGEVCMDYTFMLSAAPATGEMFEHYLSIYLETVEESVELVMNEMKPYLPGLLDDESGPEGMLERLRHAMHRHEEEIPVDDDESEGDLDLSDLFEMFDPSDSEEDSNEE